MIIQIINAQEHHEHIFLIKTEHHEHILLTKETEQFVILSIIRTPLQL